MGDHPLLPDYGGACITNVVPALLEPTDTPPPWLPAPLIDSNQVVLLVADGLGWEQLNERRELAPTISQLVGGPISSVVPSTTATALTCLSTGLTPGEHGIVGYRIAVNGEILNVLRWTTPSGDARRRIDPAAFQHHAAFCGHHPPAVTKAEFARSGFSDAHLTPVRFRGYRMPSTLVVEVRRLLRNGEPFVYAYYDGVDKVAHEYGLGEYYDAELAALDRLVADLLAVLPRNAVLAVTADHGEVHVGDNIVQLDPEVQSLFAYQSGEGRFRWLHAQPGQAAALLEAATAYHGDQAWVRSREEILHEGWFGPHSSNEAVGRLGDVALAARGTLSFVDAADTGPLELIGRHGSVTPAEMLVPFVAGQS